MTSRWIALGILISACQPAAPSVESNELGITEVTVEHGNVQGERLLTVRGLDRDGATIATATLRTGMVLYGADVTPELNAGTELAITVQEINSKFVSPDRVPHVIYEPLQPSMATFVGLHAVASAIEHEAGIQFAPPKRAASDEFAFTAAACDGARFPTNKGGASQCCQDDSNTYHLNATNAIANRATYAPAYPSIPVCRKSDGTTGCTGALCQYGPCGSAVISVQGTNGHVFHPTTNPNACGWDTGGGVFSPEAYSSQTLYGAMTATCTCTACNDNGTAQCGWADDFNRTGSLGSSWQLFWGSVSLDGANAVMNGASQLARAIPPNPPGIGTNDYSVTARVSSPANSLHTSLWLRGTSDATAYSAELQTVGQLNLWAKYNYTSVHLTSVQMTVTPDTFYTLKIIGTGSNPVHLEVWVDGTKKIAYDDYSASRIASGDAYMQGNAPNVKFDSFQIDPVTPPPAPGPAPQSGSPFIDDFNRTTGLGAANNWSVRYGGYNTDGSYAVSTNTPALGYGNWAHVIGDLGSVNLEATAVLSVPAGSINSGVFTRSNQVIDAAQNNYNLKLSTEAGGLLRLSRRNDWTGTQLATYAIKFTPGTFHTLKLVTTGSNPVHLEAWLDGVQRITYDDSSASRLTSGTMHGVVSYNDNVQFDSYRADAL